MNGRLRVLVLAALAVAAALGAILLIVVGAEDPAEPPATRTNAPAEDSAQIAALRTVPGSPPQFALVALRDDGSELRVLAAAPAREIQRFHAPAWSPDARRIYIIGVLGEREADRFTYYESDVFAVDAGGDEPQRITTSNDVAAAAPSPDGETLLVSRDEHPGKRPFTYSLWLIDAHGGNQRRLLAAHEGTLDLAGAWSPDSRTIAFTRCRFAPPDQTGLIQTRCAVYAVSRDGSNLRRLAERSSEPAFSPDGRQIAFVSDRDEYGKHATGSDEEAFSNELYLMDVEGGNQQRLTETENLDEATPAWSPDGSRIAYGRTGPVRFQKQLMIVRTDGRCPTRLIGNAAAATIGAPWFESPAWRPVRLTGDLTPLACG